MDSPLTYPEGVLKAWSAVVGSFHATLFVSEVIKAAGIFRLCFSLDANCQLRDYAASRIGRIFSPYLHALRLAGIQAGPPLERHGQQALVALGSFLVRPNTCFPASARVGVLVLTLKLLRVC